MLSPPFRLAPLSDWHLSGDIDPQRRARLLEGVPFERIVELVCADVKCVSLRSEAGTSKELKGARRAKAQLWTSPTLVDLWHNGRGGYRAQYLVSADLGDAANRYAIKWLTEAIRTHLEQCSRKLAPPAWNKVWIQEGRWWRYARRTDRHFQCPAWINATAKTDKERNLVRWGQLAPSDEPRLVLKGPWLQEGQAPTSGGKAADQRAQQIHDFGYT